MHKVSVYVADELVYFQQITDEKAAAAVVAFTMDLPTGTGEKVLIEVRGNRIEFNTSHVDVPTLVRKANAILVRTPRAPKAAVLQETGS